MTETLIFLSKYKFSSKSIKTETIFSKREINKEWNINSIQNSPLDIHYVYSAVQFSINWI